MTAPLIFKLPQLPLLTPLSSEGGARPGGEKSPSFCELLALLSLDGFLLRSVDIGLSPGMSVLDLFSILCQASGVDPGPPLPTGLEERDFIRVILATSV